MDKPKYLTDEELEKILSDSDEDLSDSDISDDDENYSTGESADLIISGSDFECEEFDELDRPIKTESVYEIVDPLYVSKDGMLWKSQPVQDRTGISRTKNLINLRPGTTKCARTRAADIKDAFFLFFPPSIENVILKWSNAYAAAKCVDKFLEIDSHLLNAYIGVLILAGVYRAKNETILDLFDAENGRPIFRAIMSRKTFVYLDQVIRFGNVMSQRQESYSDNFAPIREIFDKWSELLADYFNPSECVTIDEQLLGFRGRCKFRQYMPSKPGRYGIKFWLLVCSETCYVWRIQPYLGKQSGGTTERNQGERVVIDLVRGLKGHKITMEKFFSSYNLGQKLLSRGLTMVGRMRKNERSIPPKLLQCKQVPLFQSTFAFTENTTLVSYVGRRDKCVVLQSTMHTTNAVQSDGKKLPEIIQYYKKTKGSVDTVDKMLSCYSCKRKTNRWPMAVFSNMIDISALNAFIIFKDMYPNWQTNNKTMRRFFLRELGISLAKPYMEMRKGAPRTEPSVSLLFSISADSSSSLAQSTTPKRPRESPGSCETSPQSFETNQKNCNSVPPTIEGKARCHICYDKKSKYKNYTHKTICCFCRKGVCQRTHNRNVCVKCIADKLV